MQARKIKLQVNVDDIARARCANRRQCVLAQSINRQFKLGGKGYIRVDANGAAYTLDGKRYTYHLPSKALIYLRDFDKIGETKGEAAARRAMKPQQFPIQLIETKKIPPAASRARKDQINRARAKARDLDRAKGVLPTTYRRYTGLSSPKATA